MSHLQIYIIFTILSRKLRQLLPGCCMTFSSKLKLAQSMFLDVLLRMITRMPALSFEKLEAHTMTDSSALRKSVVETQYL